jgi:hypothetical protein
VTNNQSATRDVDARPMPRVIWKGFGIDDDGKERDDFPIRIVEVAPNNLVVETSYKDAMGDTAWKAMSMEQNWVLRALVYCCAGGALLREQADHKPAESPCHDCRHSRNDGNGLICSLGLNMMTTSCLGWRNTPQKKIPCPRCRHATRTDRGLVCGVHMLQKCDEWAATVMVKGPSGDYLCLQFIERVPGPGCEETCKTCFYKTEKNHRDTCALGCTYMSLDDLGVVGCASHCKHKHADEEK